jgi:Peptidase family M28
MFPPATDSNDRNDMRYGVPLLILLAACAGNASVDGDGARPAAALGESGAVSPDDAAATITPGDFRARIGFLASDALLGRDTPSPGLEVAAQYIASEFMRMGLEPAGDDGGYLQRYPYIPRRRDADPAAAPAQTSYPPNVVALLRGSDPSLRDTYVVFSAHMDHVGVGRPDASGDSIYNGADDDASGTSAVLEVAEAFASLPTPPARSLVFLTVSGEEKGLLGSSYYADHPTVPLDGIVANINIDMIGRNSPDTVVAIGQELSSLGPLVHRLAAAHTELGLIPTQDPWPEQGFFSRSDHFNFARKEIPAIFFFAGTHEDYHRPSDHVEDIDTDKAARIGRLVFWLGHAIATDPQPPSWTPQGLEQVRALVRGGRD